MGREIIVYCAKQILPSINNTRRAHSWKGVVVCLCQHEEILLSNKFNLKEIK